ncbi:MAG: hypothetical protein ACI81P_000840 [Neolewinella sp.]
MLTPPFYEGRADKKIELKGTRFRYEIALEDPGPNEDYFELSEENLRYIAKEDDVWAKPYLKQQGLILLYPEKGSSDLINRSDEVLVRDEEGRLKFSNISDRYEQTLLSIANGDENIHLLAVRQVFENLFAVDLASPENFSNYTSRKSNNVILKELKELATKQPEDFSSVNFQRSEGIDYLSLRVRRP